MAPASTATMPCGLGSFWDILKRSIDELPLYRNHYEEKGLLIADGCVRSAVPPWGVRGALMHGPVLISIRPAATTVARATTWTCRRRYPARGLQRGYRGAACETDGAAGDLRDLAPARDTKDRPLFRWLGEREDTVPHQSTRPRRTWPLGVLRQPRVHGVIHVEGHKVLMERKRRGQPSAPSSSNRRALSGSSQDLEPRRILEEYPRRPRGLQSRSRQPG